VVSGAMSGAILGRRAYCSTIGRQNPLQTCPHDMAIGMAGYITDDFWGPTLRQVG
jgi:hypothetical protein